MLLELGGVFHLLAGGTLRRSYSASDSSVDDWLYHQSYRVQDGALWCDFSGERWGGGDKKETSLELGGLVELPQDAAEEAAAQALLDRRHEVAQARGKSLAEVNARRLASFRAALPAKLPRLRFSFSYDGDDIVVRGPNGAVLWRDGTSGRVTW